MFMASACGSGNVITKSKQGTARDTIFSVEPRANGATVMWLTHDDIATYCTIDPAIAKQMDNLLLEHNGDVIVRYSTINFSDSSLDKNLSACSTDSISITNYIVWSITAVPARGTK